jgi:hypothetical protein
LAAAAPTGEVVAEIAIQRFGDMILSLALTVDFYPELA